MPDRAESRSAVRNQSESMSKAGGGNPTLVETQAAHSFFKTITKGGMNPNHRRAPSDFPGARP